MMFQFWFDLPKSLTELLGEELTKEEATYASTIQTTNNNISAIYDKITTTLKALDGAQTLENVEALRQIKDRLLKIQKEKSELLCKTIKFCIKLMSKTLETIERAADKTPKTLMKIKLFLKVTRLVLTQSKEEITKCQGEQQKFFTMVQVFCEKVQSKLFTVSQEILKGPSKNVEKEQTFNNVSNAAVISS